MNTVVEYCKTQVERNMFGVCEWLGQKMSIPSKRIRMFFIYASFFAAGSPVIIYLVLAFWLDMKALIRQKRGSVWDL